MATTMHWLPKMSAPREISSGSAIAAVLIETLSAPAVSKLRMSAVCPYPTADSEWDENLISRALHNVDHGVAVSRSWQ